jgi:hypothetical protein
MKNQLLEDLDDSQSRPPVLPVRRIQAVPPPQPSVAEQAPSAAPDAAPPPGARQRAGVWRSRAQSPLPPPPLHAAPPEPPPEAPRMGRIEPQIASFSSREPDWTNPLPPDEPAWTERWGRKVLGWTAVAGLAVAVSATAGWMIRETRVESTLAVVADHTPSTAPVAPAPIPAEPVAYADPEPETPPPLRMLPPEPGAPAPVALAQEPTPPVEKPAVTAAPKPAPKATAKPPVERRVATAGVKRERPQAKKPAPKPARERVLARAVTPPAPARPVQPVTQAPPSESPLAETLRLCRAAGYHATACIKRGCEATRFGLACRG